MTQLYIMIMLFLYNTKRIFRTTLKPITFRNHKMKKYYLTMWVCMLLCDAKNSFSQLPRLPWEVNNWDHMRELQCKQHKTPLNIQYPHVDSTQDSDKNNLWTNLSVYMFLMISHTKREQVSVLEAETTVCVCTTVGGLISVLVLKVIAHRGFQPQFNFGTCHRKRPPK